LIILITDANANTARADDPVTSFTVFSHGYTGSLEFGHGLGLTADEVERLSFTIDKISLINEGAFSSRTRSHFYSCNTGTVGRNGSFAQAWANQTGARTIAAVNGQTSYSNINSFRLLESVSWLIHRAERNSVGGYSVPFHSFRAPTTASGVSWGTFRPQ